MIDPLRFDFIGECSEWLASYSVSLSEAARRGNPEACRAYFRCLQGVARDLNKTLTEIENAAESETKRVETLARQADVGKGIVGGGTVNEVRGDKQQRSSMAFSDRGRSGGQAGSKRVQELETL